MLKTFIRNFQIRLLHYIIKLFCNSKETLASGRVLVLAPHPDDEIFGLGGSVLKMSENGTRIRLIYLTDGEGSGVWPDKDEIGRQRIRLSEKIAASLEMNNTDIYRLHLPDGAVPHPFQPGFEEAVNIVKDIFDTFEPDAVFATHPLDYWPFDHVACSHIAKEAVRQSETKPQLWYYWVWAWYSIRPWKLTFKNLKKLQKINIGDHLGQKKELMTIYLKALTPDGKPWSGILPKSLLSAFNHQFEVIERIK